MHAERRERALTGGFSLIEVLVALAIFGMAVIALLHLAGESTRSALVAEERVFAGVVAENRAVEAMVATPAELAAMAAAPDGSEIAGDRRWRWTRAIAPGGADGVMRIDVTVTSEGDDRIAAELHLLREAP